MEKYLYVQIHDYCCHRQMFPAVQLSGSLKNHIRLIVISLLMIFGFCGISGAETTANISDSLNISKTWMIYVADFALDVDSGSKEGKGLLPVRQKIKDTVNRTGVTGKETPEEIAKKIVDAMAESIVKELNKKNVKAGRLFSQPPPFTECLLLEGEFMDFDEGERMKRAIIGFGSGSSEMQVRILFSKIVDGKTSLLMDTATDGGKNRMPGAVVSKNPYVAGAKFVLTKNAPDKDVRKLGANIADQLYEFMVKQGNILQQENK
jgi:hypothetical protein